VWILHERVQSRGPTVDTMEGISSLLEIGLIMLGGGGGDPRPADFRESQILRFELRAGR
jgi:hypothetical protein